MYLSPHNNITVVTWLVTGIIYWCDTVDYCQSYSYSISLMSAINKLTYGPPSPIKKQMYVGGGGGGGGPGGERDQNM